MNAASVNIYYMYKKVVCVHISPTILIDASGQLNTTKYESDLTSEFPF